MITPKELRRELHRHPELSFHEERTAARIAEALTRAEIPFSPIARTGLLARIEGKANLKRAVVLRADIDALPIREESGVEFSSEVDGVMHACGHDMHAAILYGVLCALRHGEFEGTLFGLFQPAEEVNPGGALEVLREDPWRDYEVVAVLGEHVEPDLEVGTIGLRAGAYMAANDELHIHIKGEGGHAALRERVQDTVSTAARLILELLTLNSPERILSIGRVEAPGATNVIPDGVELQGTLRCFSPKVRTEGVARIQEMAKEISRKSGIGIEVEIREGYPPVVNNPDLTERVHKKALTMGYRVKELDRRPTSEDFGRYGEHYPALFYRLGVGPDAGKTHTSRFKPDERAVDIGIDLMKGLSLMLLNQE